MELGTTTMELGTTTMELGTTTMELEASTAVVENRRQRPVCAPIARPDRIEHAFMMASPNPGYTLFGVDDVPFR